MIALQRKFGELFGSTPRIFRAPGRVNLIGEHTDYNDGFVMPVAIQLSTWAAIALRNDRKLVVHSGNYSETVREDLSSTRPQLNGHWSAYVVGVAAILEQLGHRLKGADILVHTDIPIGAGLSSSAALEVVTGYALLTISEIPVDRNRLARACQRAEHEFAGVRCGMMDQMIACHGRSGHALMLDTRDLSFELLPLPGDVSIVICNTMVKHNLATDAYNTRRAECESGAKALGKSLRDETPKGLERRKTELPENIYRRCRHVISENARVQAAARALNQGKLAEFGSLMGESHRSLRDDYEVSCRELDVMVELASSLDAVAGARMTGGGFGGCTVNLVRAGSAKRFQHMMAHLFESATAIRPDIYICESASGVHEVRTTGLDAISRYPHLRFNPLLREWVQVSPHRSNRPWQGHVEAAPAETIPHFDPNCYLCPGNARAAGSKNPDYATTFAFDNDFPALLVDTAPTVADEAGLLIARGEPGVCRVLCFSPRHDLTLSQMSVAEIRNVVDAWAGEYRALAEQPAINYVLIFENRGAMMGASNPHPHSQIWATATIPNEPSKEQASMRAYEVEHQACLLCSYVKKESASKERVIFDNDSFSVVIPFWAVWPFETMIISKRHIGAIDDLDESGRDLLAATLKNITTRYDSLFQAPFPYTFGFHQRPTDGERHTESHLHAHFYPPLLRSAAIRKFMVGFEMLGTPQRDITSEQAAARLREAGERTG